MTLGVEQKTVIRLKNYKELHKMVTVDRERILI